MDWGKFLFSFNGRISRKAFWLVTLASFIISIGLNMVALGSAFGGGMDPNNMPTIPVWFWLVQIPMLWIGLAVYCKRWHDQDKSGWFSLLLLIPLLGFLIVIIMLGFIGGSPGPNRYGDSAMA
jgi:uncharacterized membrane protein YhaH (DUF805 family)